ncbi:MAG: 1-acyl-sn-glycerol-3-phosphate acyltransferase [Spirochaetes bacterium]|nr:1-acyl-sn-glycerol-3-phosphate acyltransferase [Spirochaetota bacterium]
MPRQLRDNKILFYLYQAYKLLVYFPLVGIGWTVLFVYFLILMALGARRAALKVPILWARYSSLITPMTVTVAGNENIDPAQSYVLVANHQSQYDIFVIYGWLPVDFKWVMKAELGKVPIIGASCRRLGHVFIDRSDHQKAVKSINEAKERIRNGTSIMFFPEGHRSAGREMLPFKKGAFKFALDIGLPLLPITILGTRNILPTNSTALFPGRARLVIHKPIPIEGYHEGNIEELMALTRGVIGRTLDQN